MRLRGYMRLSFGSRKKTKAQLRAEARLKEHGHPFTCTKRKNPTKKQEEQGWPGSNCGRAASVVWRRVKGSGSMLMARCPAHSAFDPHHWSKFSPESEEDFVCVPATELRELEQGLRVKRTLEKRSEEGKEDK